MKTCVKLLISSGLICCVYTGDALGAQVRIDPAGYLGQWTVDYGLVQQGVVIVDLGDADPASGLHVISIGGAELSFGVAVDGEVTVENSVAATGGAGTLTFNTATILVNPVSFSGLWRVTDGATADLSGPQYVTLVPGLSFYSLEVGANGGFSFDLAGSGRVTVRNDTAAIGSYGYLELKNTQRFLRGQR